MKKQSGFTLIELVVVVFILGILAVTAIPKFIDLTDQAQQANIEGMAGGFATGVSLVRAQWESEGRPKNAVPQNTVDYDGSVIILTTENKTSGIRPGYPVGLVGGPSGQADGAALGGDFDSNNCVAIWRNILQQPPKVTNSISELNNDDAIRYFASKSGDNATSKCHFYLRDTLNRDSNNNVLTPGTSTNVGNSFTYLPATSEVVVHINKS